MTGKIHRLLFWVGVFSAGFLQAVALNLPAAEFTVTDLRADNYPHALGIDSVRPALSWEIESSVRGKAQSAYEIQVASASRLLTGGQPDLWDSGRVVSDSTREVFYHGTRLKSSQQVFWRVRAWNEDGKVSAWSPPATWTMGVLTEADWHAHWIGAANTNAQSLVLHREFMVRPGLHRAIAQVCGLGQYEMNVNGKKAGDDLLAPGWTQYDKTCLYDTRDITAQLHRGTNAVGIILGDGMYRVLGGSRFYKFTGSFGPLKAIAQLRLEYADGTVELTGTDSNWWVLPSPITFSSVYGGEDFDARREVTGWSEPGLDTTKYSPAMEVAGPGGQLRGLSCAAPPIKSFEIFKPVSQTVITNGVTVYDLGQNAPIMPRIMVSGPPGSVVRIIPAELIGTNGRVNRISCGGRPAYWQYTLAGKGEESWFPRFFYHGCRYLQVEQMPAPRSGELPEVKSLEGVVVHSSSTPVGEFQCSNELFNRIHTLIRWAQRANLVSLISDCPHRERLGWLEQYHLNGPSLRYEFNLEQLYVKGMNDMADVQLPGGFVPNIAPEYVVFGKDKEDMSNPFRNSPEWGSSFVIVPWQQFEFTGDVEPLRRHYEAMKRYVACLGSTATNNIVNYGLGDWYDIGPQPPGYSQLTPKALTATAFYYYDTWILAQAANLLDKPDEAAKFSAQAGRIRAAFNEAFFDPTNGSYATGSQCANAIPLVMGLAEETNRAGVLNAIVADVHRHGDAITAGDVGYRYLLRALAEGGRSDLVFTMNNQSEKPGYGYQLRMGATSLTEAWNADIHSSQNHFMLGQIMEWFYHDLAGIQADLAQAGFKHIIIHPAPAGDVTWVKARYASVRGPIVSEWHRDGEKFILKIEVPANTTATVLLPGTEGRLLEPASGSRDSRFVTSLGEAGGRAGFSVKSGRYIFQARCSAP